MSQLLITEDYLKDTTPMGDHVDMKVLTPVIEWVQDIYLRPLLGQDLYELLLTQSTPPTSLTTANNTLLNDHVLKVGRFYVMAEAVRTMKYRYTNKGIMTATSENGTSITSEDENILIDDWKAKAERYAEIMVDFIWEHWTDYPTYWTQGNAYRERPRPGTYDSPVSFGTKKTRYHNNDEGDFRFRV